MAAENLRAENAELRHRLEEAEETIRAIQTGAVDAFVIEEPDGRRVYTLEGADRPYRLLVEEMQQGAATLDAAGTIVYCNSRLAGLLGVPLEKLTGAALHDYVVDESRPAYASLFEQGKTGTSRGEARLQRASGAIVPAYLTLNVLPKDCGAVIGVLVTDLTEQQAQQRISDLLSELREIDRRKDEFLATLAHELRGPLAPLRNMLEVMKGADSNAALVEQARSTMDRQLVQMTRLIDDLLDVSRISRGRIELRREQVDLASVVHQALEACRPLAEQAQHTMDVILPAEAILVHADPVRLAQVFSNLLNNACKYTAAGGRIWLTAERQGSYVDVTIRDNGLGIPADKLAGIFEMFTQVDQSLERSQGGLGIGLTLAQRLVELHGGTLAAHSEGPGKGSEFTVRLPVLADESQRQVTARPADSPAATQRILIVDDNRDSAESLALLLDLAGHETFVAHDGLEAVAAAEQFRPDVILLDLGLPKLNGFDAARRIRSEPWGKTMRLIALTGWGQEEDRRRSSDSGFDAHMVKPVDPAALMSLLASGPRIQAAQAEQT